VNVIITNKYQAMLASLDIEIIKSLNGEFDVEEIVETFKNFYFQRMILDITALKDYKDIKTIQKLSVGLDMSKVILILDDSEDSTSSAYLSKLISMGIYNFARNKESIMYLYNNPNTYRDVAHIHQLEEVTDTIIEKIDTNEVRMIGVKNITDHAGATTLVYMLKKQLEKNYDVVAIEVNKHDFVYFEDKKMVSVNAVDLPKEIMKYKDVNIILIDLNNFDEDSVCNDVLYLIEPTSIKLNKMMIRDSKIFSKLKNKKIVLNQSLLESKDILDFEYESKSKVYFSIPPLDDKANTNPSLDILLTKLGFVKQKENVTEAKNKLFGLFKF